MERRIRAKAVLSNADPKRTFLQLADVKELPGEFVEAVRGIKMAGPCAKVNMVLSEEPRFTGTRAEATPAREVVVHAGALARICRAVL